MAKAAIVAAAISFAVCAVLSCSVSTAKAQTNGCVQWTQVNTPSRPSPRYAQQMTFDSRRGVVVLYGGNIGGSAGIPVYSNETWEYNGATWTQRNIPNPPPARGTGAMIFDERRGVCVLFGGQSSTSYFGDTWEYDGASWVQRQLPGSTPVPRLSHFMAYDVKRGVSVLFGGYGGSSIPGALLGDTWEYDGLSWNRRELASAPLPRVSGGTAYDDIRGRVVMFAGGGDFRATAETWEFDGQNWTLRFNNVSFWRITPAMCFDKSRGDAFAFGGILGNIRFADEFDWNGEAWRNYDNPGPNGRSDSVVVYDTRRMRAVLFGGESSQPARLNDTWELRNLNPIVIGAGPVAQSASAGDPVTFSVAASGSGLTYQWRRDCRVIPGAVGSSLTLTATHAAQGLYDVLVSNTCGTIVSSSAALVVSGPGGCAADFNRDGVLDPDDLSDYVGCYFTGFCPAAVGADFNADSLINPDDLSDYIGAYFSGC